MLASPAHLYMPHLSTHCLPIIICVMLMSIVFFIFLLYVTFLCDFIFACLCTYWYFLFRHDISFFKCYIWHFSCWVTFCVTTYWPNGKKLTFCWPINKYQKKSWAWSRSVMNVVYYECGLLWTWSGMNVFCCEQVCNERGLFWMVCFGWSVVNRSVWTDTLSCKLWSLGPNVDCCWLKF